MDQESEMIRQQMAQTRASLSDRLEKLEQQVVGTVHDATAAVSGTVESVKDAVQTTMETAKESVQDTVAAVKHSLDLTEHVQHYPWAMVGGSVVAGYLAGCFVDRRTLEALKPGHWRKDEFTVPTGVTRHNGFGQYGSPGTEERISGVGHDRPAARFEEPGAEEPGLLSQLGTKFESEIHQLTGLGIATALGVVRDLVNKTVQGRVGEQLADIVDSVTVKLGAEPIPSSELHRFAPRLGTK
jgi:ElaB/YqjD/DUF883 family membrane-anchored ribosome-binding protein